MQTLYKIGFHIKPLAEGGGMLDRLVNLHAGWLKKSRNGPRVDLTSVISFGSAESEWGKGDVSVKTWSYQDDQRLAWAMRMSHQDSRNESWRWVTEATYCESVGKPSGYGLTLGVERQHEIMEPFVGQPSRPKIVGDLLDSFYCGDRFRLLPRPHRLKDDEVLVGTFIRFLEMKERQMPVLLISAENTTDRPMIDIKSTADVLAGLAHVVVAENANVSTRLRHHLPFNLNCFNGYMRLYWPGFSVNDPSKQHPFWDRRELTLAHVRNKRHPGELVMESILEAALFHEIPGVVKISDIDDWQNRQRLDSSRTELLKAGKEIEYIEIMEGELAALRADKQQLSKALKESESTIANLRGKVSSLTYALEGGADEAEASQAVRDPQTVDEALSLVEHSCGNLVFAFNSKSEEKAYPFERAEDVFLALEWLNTVYVDSKTGKASCPDLNHSLRESVNGWSFSPNQKESTMKANAEWYTCTWEGRKYTIEEHMRYGTGTKPEHCIRIAFAWDGERKKVVIGYLGQHQRNTKS